MRTGQYEMMITPGKVVNFHWPVRQDLTLTVNDAEEKYTLVVFHDPSAN